MVGRGVTTIVGDMIERFNIAKEVDRILAGSQEESLRILPALAGEFMADDDPVSLADLRDALAHHVLQQRPNHDVANAVLAMLRTHALQQAAHFNH